MKCILSFFLLSFTLNVFAQNGYYEHFFLDCFEGVKIRQDSFIYSFRCGLTGADVPGFIAKKGDTLIMNSNVQPKYSVDKFHKSEIDPDSFVVEVIYPLFILGPGFRYIKGEKVRDIDYSDIHQVRLDNSSKSSSQKYFFSSKSIKKGERFNLIIYGTNFFIEIDPKSNKSNYFLINLSEFPEVFDYEFFTNRKAIILEGDLVFLDEDDKLEKSHFLIRRRHKLIMSKWQKVKRFKLKIEN